MRGAGGAPARMEGRTFTSEWCGDVGEQPNMDIGEVIGTQLEGDGYRASLSAQSWQYMDDHPSTFLPPTHGGVHGSNGRPSLAMAVQDVYGCGGRGAYPTTMSNYGMHQGSSGVYGQCTQQPRMRAVPPRTDSPRWGCVPEHSVQSSQSSQHRLQGLPPLSLPVNRRTATMGEDNSPGQARAQQIATGASGTRAAGGPSRGAGMGSAEEQQQPSGMAEHVVDEVERPRSVLTIGGEGRTTASQGMGGGGEKRKAPKPSPQPKKNSIWTLEERVLLAKVSSEDDALMADAEGAHCNMTKSRRYDWIADRMKEEGYTRSGEDCRKKWVELTKKVKEIRDACDRSGKPTYWGFTTKERKKLGINMTFERALWDAMEWYRTKAAFSMDNTMASKDVKGGGCTAGNDGWSEGIGTDASDSATKTRRTSSGKSRGGDPAPSSPGLVTTMEESTRSVCDGLDRVASTLARASAEGAAMLAARIGDVATEIGHVAGAMQQGNSALEMLVGVMAGRA
ncbi:hypothetical protein CBR_g30633 [Chara braunii]|uniref:Myb-like domain-containing protein n=1 Tax=Chara braunii TaxID=69332 RepID=A0A388LDB3_CHABU|nr:hypothetical protein CBR_g30633 [Chara braunii]|eukprot:GBG80267.1 hypothetical protein CBR_g30633 [Chara braunii]